MVRQLFVVKVFILFVILESVDCSNACAPCKCGRDYRSVDCKTNTIKTLVKTVPDSLKDRIISINFQGQPLLNVSQYFFSSKYTRSLQEVSFRACKIRIIHEEAFWKLINITYLDLANNDIASLNKHTFQENINLLSLSLAGNKIRGIENDLFKNLKSLTKLDVSSNKLERIERHAFLYNKALQELDFRQNNLRAMDGNIIKELESLNIFYHHMNPWICDCYLNKLRENVRSRNVIYTFYGLQPICKEPYKLYGKELYKLNATDFTCGLTIIPNGLNTVYINEGDNVTFACLISDNLESNIKWKREELTVDPVKPNRKYELTKLQFNQTMMWYNLTILRVSPLDDGLYMCWKNSSAGEEEATINLKVQLLEAPNITVFPDTNITVDTDTVNFTVSCKIRSVPKAEVIWMHNNRVIEPVSVKNNVKITQFSESHLISWSNLTITKVNYEYRGQYRCIANNSRYANEAIITLLLNSLRSPNVTIISDTRAAVTSETITLACRVSAVPEPGIKWMFRFLTINPETGSNKYVLHTSRTMNGIYWYNMTIINITEHDNGEYKCEAENSNGKDNSSLHIKVLSFFKPSVIKSTFRNDLLNDHINIILACKVHGYPIPNVSWFYNGMNQIIATSTNRKYFLKNTVESEDIFWSYLNVTNASVNDIGEYECRAQNIQGISDKKFVIIPGKNVTNKKIPLLICIMVAEEVYKCSNISQNAKNNVITKQVQKPAITNIFDFLKMVKNEYDNVILTCKIKAFPPPDIYWILNENIKINSITPNNSKYSVYSHFQGEDLYMLQLFINNITMENEGHYQCFANNSMGIEKNSLHLQVKKTENKIALTKIEIICLVLACVALTALLCILYTKCRQRNARTRFRRMTYIHNRFSQFFGANRSRNQSVSQNHYEQVPLRNMQNIRNSLYNQYPGWKETKTEHIYEEPKETKDI